jgi:deazaflavin-dependent oxidoreductase (nitroreductase family)
MSRDLAALAEEDYCYVTTTGRVTGQPREIEIWFGRDRSTLYLLSGGGDASDWVRNMRKTSSVAVRVGERTFDATARIVTKEAEGALARRLLLEKYSPRYSGDLSDWGKNGLPVAIDLALD